MSPTPASTRASCRKTIRAAPASCSPHSTAGSRPTPSIGSPASASPSRPSRTAACFRSPICSDTIIDCFLNRARELQVPLLKNHALTGIQRLDDGGFSLRFENQETPVIARAVCFATGSLKASPLLTQLKKLEQPIEPLVPSLFAFNVADPRIADLAGIAHPKVSIRREGQNAAQSGPLLITHRGFSGPAVLRLSAWEARALAETNHQFPFIIDWLPELDMAALKERFAEIRRTQSAKLIRNTPIAPIPRRLWERIVACCRHRR